MTAAGQISTGTPAAGVLAADLRSPLPPRSTRPIGQIPAALQAADRNGSPALAPIQCRRGIMITPSASPGGFSN